MTAPASARTQQNELRSLMRATESLLLAAHDEQTVLASAANVLGEHFGYSTRSILLYQKAADELVMGHTAGPGADDPAVLAWRRKLGEGLSGIAAKTRTIVNVGDLRSDVRTVRISRGQVSRICVPMLVRDELLGVVVIESPESNAFTERDEELLTAFSGVAALALIHARSEQRSRNDIAQLQAVGEVATAAASLDLAASLKAAVEAFRRVTTSDSVAIHLWDEATERLALAEMSFNDKLYPTDYELSARQSRIALGEGMIGWSALTREASMIDDTSQDPRPRALPGIPLEAKSAIVVPLVVEDRLFGVVRAVKMGVGAYANEHFRFAQTLASQLALLLAAAQARERAEKLAMTDALTGLYNARYFHERLSEEIARARRYQHSLALIIVDSDALKRTNDQMGHAAGNQLLVDLARAIRDNVRGTDLIARFGGDEFVILQPEADEEAATAVAERIRAAAYSSSEVAGLERSVSAGVAICPTAASDPDALFRAADEALYRAKRAGKNKVEVARR